MIVAGEVSGDLHAGRLLEALRRRQPDIQAFGIGGDTLRSAGMEICVDLSKMAVMGVSEVLRRLPFFHRVFHRMAALARKRRPDAVVLVDYPGFNLRFAARAHALGLKTIYYVCPQVWAWNRARIPRMAQVVDRLISIFPFEAEHFKGTGLRVDYVGHPLVDEAARERRFPAPNLPWQGSPRIALLPGSRATEVARLLPAMLGAARLAQARYPQASFLLPVPAADIGDCVRRLLTRLKRQPERCTVVEGAARQVLRTADAALVASGTATLEAALMNCPTVIVYRVAPLTYLLGRLLVRVPHIGIMNIVAGRRICPEFLQGQVTPEALADAVLPLAVDGPPRRTMRAALEEATARLGSGGAVQRAADSVLEELGNARISPNG
jgi:lipid-A-disaccharide synthase